MKNKKYEKETHVWLEIPEHIDVLTDYKSTGKAIFEKKQIVHTTQLHFLSWAYNRRLFVHINTDDFDGHEITLEECVGTNREIREGHNIEKMLLAGEFNWF